MQFPPFPRYLIPPRSKYSPQHHVLKHPQLPFLPKCQRPSFTPIQNNRQNYWIAIWKTKDSAPNDSKHFLIYRRSKLNFQVTHPRCVEYKLKYYTKYYIYILHNQTQLCFLLNFGPICRVIFILFFRQVECTIDNALKLRVLVLQELVEIIEYII